MSVLSLSDVSVGYDGKAAITGISFDIFENDFIGITGPNGGGKTTLVKAILGLVPYTGKIQYADGVSYKDGGIGYLPQVTDFDLSFPIKVRDVVLSGFMTGRHFANGLSVECRNRAEELMEMTCIYRLKNRQIGELSGGELQKTLLCRAIISEPKLLILDEPANFVDARFENELYEIIEQLNNRMAIIMISHGLRAMAGRVKRLMYVDGTARELSPSLLAERGAEFVE